MIHLREISQENFWEIISLEVLEEQKCLVTSNAVSIAQSKVQKECVPMAIYKEGEPVGFLMYCIDTDDDEWWIYRMMIDNKFQNKGIGREALHLIIGKMKEDTTRHKIHIGVDESGGAAIHLYQSIGFKLTGQVFGKEKIMVLEY